MTSIEPPLNFGLVSPGVYRSGFPGRHNLSFLQRLGLRTLVRLVDCDYHHAVSEWIDENGVRVLSFGMTMNQEPFVGLDSATLLAALSAIQQPELRPLLVHGLRGQQATGVLVGCLRRQQRWLLTAIFDEYRRYASSAASVLDLQMIELLDASAQRRPPQPLQMPFQAPASVLPPPPPVPDGTSVAAPHGSIEAGVSRIGDEGARAAGRPAPAVHSGLHTTTEGTSGSNRGPTRLF